MLNPMVVFTFFCFKPEILFLAKSGPKNENCHFKLKSKHTKFNSGVHSFCFRLEMQFLCKFGQKSQNFQFQLKLGT